MSVSKKWVWISSAWIIVALPLYAASSGVGKTPDTIWKALLEGNSHFAAGKATHPHQTVAYRNSLAQGQHPVAVVVACADSRVAPEYVFDQGLGDLFVVRTAGNLVGDLELGSIEYAVEHLGAQLIIVEGHEKCGAVSAATSGAHVEGSIAILVKQVKVHLKDQPQNASLTDAVNANVKSVVEQLRHATPSLAKKVAQGSVKVIGCRYDISSGKVEVL